MPANLTVFKAHEIASHLEEEIQSEVGADVEISTHIDPLIFEEAVSGELTNDEVVTINKTIQDCMTQVEVIEDAHNILVRKINGKIFITLHCHANDDVSIESSHRAGSILKNLIKEKVGNIYNVFIHIEPKSLKE